MERQMKVLVTGTKGQLGYDVVNELEKRGHTAVAVDIEEMDITDAVSVERVITEAEVEAVIHCAAYTALMLRKIMWKSVGESMQKEPRILQRYVKN